MADIAFAARGIQDAVKKLTGVISAEAQENDASRMIHLGVTAKGYTSDLPSIFREVLIQRGNYEVAGLCGITAEVTYRFGGDKVSKTTFSVGPAEMHGSW